MTSAFRGAAIIATVLDCTHKNIVSNACSDKLLDLQKVEGPPLKIGLTCRKPGCTCDICTKRPRGGCLGGCTLCTVTLLAQSGSREFCRLDGVCVLQAERGASRGRGGGARLGTRPEF